MTIQLTEESAKSVAAGLDNPPEPNDKLKKAANNYTDSRGLRITDERMDEDLKTIGKTDSEVREFLGDEIVDLPGCMSMFMQSSVQIMQYFFTMKKIKEEEEVNVVGGVDCKEIEGVKLTHDTRLTDPNQWYLKTEANVNKLEEE